MSVRVPVRCALICCSCDLLAGRKLCGFLGHSTHLGCSKCKKYFPSTGSGLGFSGFRRDSWIPRSDQSHRENVLCVAQRLIYARRKVRLDGAIQFY